MQSYTAILADYFTNHEIGIPIKEPVWKVSGCFFLFVSWLIYMVFFEPPGSKKLPGPMHCQNRDLKISPPFGTGSTFATQWVHESHVFWYGTLRSPFGVSHSVFGINVASAFPRQQKTRWWFQIFFIFTRIPGEMIQVDYFSKQNRIYEAHRGNVLVLVGTAMSADLSCPQDPLPESRFPAAGRVWWRGRLKAEAENFVKNERLDIQIDGFGKPIYIYNPTHLGKHAIPCFSMTHFIVAHDGSKGLVYLPTNLLININHACNKLTIPESDGLWYCSYPPQI